MGFLLLVDFGSTFTKLTAVDLEKKDIIGTSKATTTVETDISVGFLNALSLLREAIGDSIEFDRTLACSSAAGGLKMAAIGLVQELTVEAAKRVCLGAGAKVELTLDHHLNNSEIDLIKEKKIDIILLAGGTNGGNSETVLHNANKLANSNIDIPIIYAGNKDVIDEITSIFSLKNKQFYICENVMPKINVLNIESSKDKIKEIFVTNIIKAKGISKIEKRVDGPIIPTPNAVLIAAELLSKGFGGVEGLGDLVLVDIGGATTDIYSMADGLPKKANVVFGGLEEPYAKRTVEGDLGMCYSILGIIDSMSKSEIHQLGKQNIDIVLEARTRHHDPYFVPKNDNDWKISNIFSSKCIDVAFSRHVGTYTSVYTPMGNMYHQIGKDLTETKYIIGTGGALINSKNPKVILETLKRNIKTPNELRPDNPEYLLDSDYILSAMGLLANEYPDVALEIMRKRIIKI